MYSWNITRSWVITRILDFGVSVALFMGDGGRSRQFRSLGLIGTGLAIVVNITDLIIISGKKAPKVLLAGAILDLSTPRCWE